MINGPKCLNIPTLLSFGTNGAPGTHEYWLAEHQALARRAPASDIGLDAKRYDDPKLAWAQRAFVQPQVMIEDRYLYDPATGRYTVDRLLADFRQALCGVDAVMIWPTLSEYRHR